MSFWDEVPEEPDLVRPYPIDDAMAEPSLVEGEPIGGTNQVWDELRNGTGGGYDPSSFLHDGYVHRKKALRTGLKWVDRSLGGGLYPGLNVLNAEPAAGKSLFAIQTATNVALNGGKVLYFTSELPSNQVIMRALAYTSTQLPELEPFGLTDARQNAHELRKREEELGSWDTLLETELGDDTKDKVARAFHAFENLCQGFMPYEVTSIDEIKDILIALRKPKDMKDKVTPTLVVVDYLQRLRPPNNMDSRADEKAKLDAIVKRLTDYGNKAQVPVLCISSMNRASMNAGITSMHVSSGTGQIEFDATTSIVMVNAKRKALDANDKRKKDDLGNDVIEQVEKAGPMDEACYGKPLPVVNWYVAKCREYPYDSNKPDTMLRDGAHSRFVRFNQKLTDVIDENTGKPKIDKNTGKKIQKPIGWE